MGPYPSSREKIRVYIYIYIFYVNYIHARSRGCKQGPLEINIYTRRIYVHVHLKIRLQVCGPGLSGIWISMDFECGHSWVLRAGAPFLRAIIHTETYTPPAFGPFGVRRRTSGSGARGLPCVGGSQYPHDISNSRSHMIVTHPAKAVQLSDTRGRA